jgi:hypothetical protein
MNWISVKDKNPSKNEKYFVCLINNIPIVGFIVERGTIYTIKNTVAYCLDHRGWVKDPHYAEITHWMPLPLPPKEILPEELSENEKMERTGSLLLILPKRTG